MIIDKTYFNGILELPNLNEPEPNNKSNNLLDLLIAQSEDYVLSMAFGREMLNDVISNSANYEGLIKGEEYAKNGKNLFWRGIIQEDTKTSLLADYVYYIYRTHNITQSTEFGEVSFEAKVGQRVSSTPKLVKVWNSFLSKYQGGIMHGHDGVTLEGNPFWIVPNRLGNGFGIDYYGVQNDGDEVSLLQYLKDNASKYPLLKGLKTIGEQKNSFGL